jgi:hypothetical protein
MEEIMLAGPLCHKTTKIPHQVGTGDIDTPIYPLGETERSSDVVDF